MQRGLSQEELAEKAELHRTYIGMIPRGEKNITLINIGKIAKALAIAVDELLNKFAITFCDGDLDLGVQFTLLDRRYET